MTHCATDPAPTSPSPAQPIMPKPEPRPAVSDHAAATRQRWHDMLAQRRAKHPQPTQPAPPPGSSATLPPTPDDPQLLAHTLQAFMAPHQAQPQAAPSQTPESPGQSPPINPSETPDSITNQFKEDCPGKPHAARSGGYPCEHPEDAVEGGPRDSRHLALRLAQILGDYKSMPFYLKLVARVDQHQVCPDLGRKAVITLLLAKAKELRELRKPKGYVQCPAAVFAAWVQSLAHKPRAGERVLSSPRNRHSQGR